MSDRTQDIAMQLVRALRPESDIRRNQRVERAIDNQGNPILDNITIVVGSGGGGTVVVPWGAITGAIADQADLAAALAGKAASNHTHPASAITSGVIAVARLGAGTPAATTYLRGDGVWATFPTSLPPGAHTHAIPDVTGLQSALDDKADDLDVTILVGLIQNLQITKADVGHTHPPADLQASNSPSATTFYRGDGQWIVPTNTTYSVMTQAEAENNASTTGRLITGQRLAQAIAFHPPAAHTHPISAITNLSTQLLDLASGIDGKANLSHTHAAADITSGVIATARLGSGIASSSVFLRGDGTWAAVAVGSHTHAIADVTNLQAALDAKTDNSVHNLLAAIVTTLSGDLDALETTVAGKADTSHAHAAADISSGVFAVARLGTGTPSGSNFLRGDGTWATPPNTTYSAISQAEAENPASTTARLVTGQRMAQAINKQKQASRLSANVETSSTVAAAVTALNVAVGVNERWQITFQGPVGCNGAGGLDLGVTVPTGSQMNATLMGSDGGVGSATVLSMRLTSGNFGVAIGKNAYGFGIAAGMVIVTVVVETGGTAGNVSLTLRSNTAGQTSAVGTNTMMAAHRMPS